MSVLRELFPDGARLAIAALTRRVGTRRQAEQEWHVRSRRFLPGHDVSAKSLLHDAP